MNETNNEEFFVKRKDKISFDESENRDNSNRKPTLAYIMKRKNVISQLLFIAAFSLIFLNVYKPFNATSWMMFSTNKTYYFLSTLLLVAGGITVISLSRIIMSLFTKKFHFTYLGYVIWVICEIVVMAFIYCIVNKLILHGTRDFFDVFPDAFLGITLVLLIPYVLSFLYLALQEKNIHLAEALEMSKYINEDNYFDIQPNQYATINFNDEKGALRLSIKFSSLYYIESSDNYVNIFYENKGKATHFLLRKSLKCIEETYSDYHIIRCHRSFIVNIDKVKIIKREKDGFIIDFDTALFPNIPVSKTYSENVLNTFHI